MSVLQNRFGAPPFSVLNTQLGYWQSRKKQWISELGIKSELGRNEGLAYSYSAQGTHIYELRNKMREEMKREPTWEEIKNEAERKKMHTFTGTSIFDPFLCELLYTWFSQENDSILDPFCGGSVRGVVASQMKRKYLGIDLRAEQVKANYSNLRTIRKKTKGRYPKPNWIAGDSTELESILGSEQMFDFVFSCPPYFSLEKYSDDKKDLSTQSTLEFIRNYRSIIKQSCKRLKENRFACFIVSNVRCKDTGVYQNLVQETIDAFKLAGLEYYNEFILVNAIGSLPIRMSRPFNKSRKNGRLHQNVLVFYKGDTANMNLLPIQYKDFLENAIK
ncbi:DNA methyltransferase [Bernardetia sp. Wsw4-3y2]|uniref:DNA methyltransferase n=1 Tax=Bernardetia sp. Wsw4-3y2 TaxID=3127471 RepID=UPI0030D40937